jgi:phage terminase large subunit
MHYLPAYLAYFKSQARYALLYGGAGSGKSVTAAQKSILQCLLYPGAQILCIRKYRSTLRQSVYPLLQSQLQHLPPQFHPRASVTQLTFLFPNGSQIRCLGLDDPEKIKSIQGISSIWVEEATELRLEDFTQLELRVRGNTPGYKQFTLTFNPTDQAHWLYKRFFAPSTNQPTTFSDSQSNPFILHTTYLANTELDAAYINHLSQSISTDSNLYRIYTLGQWGHRRRGGEFYKGFNYATHVISNPYNPDLPLHLSFDFNLHPYITCTLWQLETNSTHQIARQISELCLSSPANTTSALCKALLLKYPNHTTGAFIYGDPSGSNASPLTDARTTHYNIIESALASWFPSMRVALSAPPVARRALFINEVFAGSIPGLSISIDPSCTHTLQDYQNLLESPDGSKLKQITRDPLTSIRSQSLGHTSDANDYLLCQAYQSLFRTFEHAGRPLAMPLFGSYHTPHY